MSVRVTGILIFLAVTWSAAPTQAQPPEKLRGNCTDAGCHDAFSKRAVLHPAAEPGACDTCHEQTQEGRHLFKLTLEGAELCEECHDDLSEDRKFLHGPVAAGACTACHNPHASDHPGMLFAVGTALCLKCHDEIQKKLEAKKHKHPPAEEDCGVCHDPHGADNRMNLTSSPPDLCTDCHDDIADILDEAKVGHDAVTQDKTCLNCHEPHAGDVEHLLAAKPMDLCLSCHDEELKSGNDSLGNLAQKLKDNPNHHGPIRQKDCSACHTQVHGGANHRLLLAAYPPEFYAPFDEKLYAFCFECHESELVADERTEEDTNFRNADVNLHYLHVHRKAKGRTCRACHDPHASKAPKYIAQSVPFGAWNIPIHFRKTETGGSCLPGCHKRYGYDRTRAVINIQR